MIPLPPPSAPDIALAFFYFASAAIVSLVGFEIALAIRKLCCSGNRRKSCPKQMSHIETCQTPSGTTLYTWKAGERWPTVTTRINQD